VEIFLAARQVSEVAELRAKWPIEFPDNSISANRSAIFRTLRSVHPPDGTPGDLTASDATPREALDEGVDLIVMAPGESQ
jgi:hypothetical protein